MPLPFKGLTRSEKILRYGILGIGLLFGAAILSLDIESFKKAQDKTPQIQESTAAPVAVAAEDRSPPSDQITEGLNKLEQAKSEFGPESSQVAKYLHDMGDLYDQQGMNTEAESHYEAAVTLWERIIATDQTLSAKSMTRLGMLYSKQRRSAEAEELLVRAIAIWNQSTDMGDPIAKSGVETLAALYEDTGRIEEAKSLRDRANLTQ